jgi:predicted MFS family arabinose efflux permease
VVGVVSALLLGSFSVRFKAKPLLLTGLMALSVSSLVCSLAPSYGMMLFFYSMVGIGMAVVPPMAFTLVAEHFPPGERSKVIGWIVAGMTLAGVIGSPIIGFISNTYGWRMAYLVFAFPFSLFAMILSAKVLPSTSESDSKDKKRGNIMEGYKDVLTNRSATACLISSVLMTTAWQAIVLYSSSFYRDHFLLPLSYTSIVLTGSSLIFTLASLMTSRFVDRFGRKPVAVASAFIAGLGIVSYTVLPNLYLSIASRFMAALFTSLMYNALNSLTLEQVPKFRGTMMSLNQAAGSLGLAIGGGIGGIVFLIYGYKAVGPSLGALMFVAAVVFHIFVVDLN